MILEINQLLVSRCGVSVDSMNLEERPQEQNARVIYLQGEYTVLIGWVQMVRWCLANLDKPGRERRAVPWQLVGWLDGTMMEGPTQTF